jgi:hypothetical protein
LQRADASSGQQPREQQRYAAEFLQRWPRSKADAYRAFDYIQQLQLHALSSFSFAGHDWVAALKKAVERGQVVVSVEVAPVASGGSGGQPARGGPPGVLPYPLADRSMVAVGAAEPGSYLDSVGSSARVFDDYSDVSAGDLIAYLQSVVAGVGAVGSTSELAGDSPDADASTPLGDAQPFELGDDSLGSEVQQDAGVFLSPAEEAECEMQLEADKDECSAWYVAKPSSYSMCMDRAMQRYANCLRGVG